MWTKRPTMREQAALAAASNMWRGPVQAAQRVEASRTIGRRDPGCATADWRRPSIRSLGGVLRRCRGATSHPALRLGKAGPIICETARAAIARPCLPEVRRVSLHLRTIHPAFPDTSGRYRGLRATLPPMPCLQLIRRQSLHSRLSWAASARTDGANICDSRPLLKGRSDLRLLYNLKCPNSRSPCCERWT
jgi:hypothetical protein